MPVELSNGAARHPGLSLWGAGGSTPTLRSSPTAVSKSLLEFERRGAAEMVAVTPSPRSCDTLVNLREIFRRQFAADRGVLHPGRLHFAARRPLHGGRRGVLKGLEAVTGRRMASPRP